MILIDAVTGAELANATIGDTGGPSGLAWLDSTNLVISQQQTFGAPVQLWRLSFRPARFPQ